MPADTVIHSMELSVGRLTVAYDWRGYKLTGDEQGDVPTRTVVRFLHTAENREFVIDDPVWAPPMTVRTAALAYLQGAEQNAAPSDRLRALSALRAAYNGELPGDQPTNAGVSAKPLRFTIDPLDLTPGIFQVYDEVWKHQVLRGTETQCKAYANSLNYPEEK